MFILILLEILLLQYYFSMFFLLLYIYTLIHPVAHLTMTTFVQDLFLYLVDFHMKIVCSTTGIDLTNCSLCLFMKREPGIA